MTFAEKETIIDALCLREVAAHAAQRSCAEAECLQSLVSAISQWFHYDQPLRDTGGWVPLHVRAEARAYRQHMKQRQQAVAAWRGE